MLPAMPAAAVEPVEIVVVTVASDGSGMDRAVAAGARGVVVAATGSGNTHPDYLRAAMAAMDAGVAVGRWPAERVPGPSGRGTRSPAAARPGGGRASRSPAPSRPSRPGSRWPWGSAPGFAGEELADLLGGPRLRPLPRRRGTRSGIPGTAIL